MTGYRTIDCGDYDFIEIACLDRYQVQLTLTDGDVTGVAAGVASRDGGEFIELTTQDGNSSFVRLDRIRVLTVMSRPARFLQHTFSNDHSGE